MATATSDGSGVHRVVQRLEQGAKQDAALAQRLNALSKEVPCAKS
jgi:hypothetical protein